MGFKAISTRRTSATSAVSNQAVVVNTGTGNLSVSGSKITANTSISLEVITPGQSTANSSVSVSGGPSITSFVYLDANNNPTSANAVSTSGGNIKITGSGFVSGSSVYINNTLVSNTFVSSTEIRAVCPSASAGNVSLFIFTPTNSGALSSTSIRYSGAPSWTTAAVSFANGTTANVALEASSDSTLTYTLQAGSTLPTGISLESAGYLSGTPTGYTNSATSTAVLIATDLEGQATQQTITWTVSVGEPQFYLTTLLLNGDTGTNLANAATNNTFLDSSSNNFTVTRTGTTTQGSFTPFSQTGWSNYLPGGAGQVSFTSNAVFGYGTGDFTWEMWFNPSSTPNGLYLLDHGAGNAGTISFNGSRLVYYNATTGTGSSLYTTGFGNSFSLGTWYHVAAVRRSGVTYLYLDGTLTTSASDTNNYPTAVCLVGQYGGGNLGFVGYISNVRLVKGVGVYTGNFTPPTSALAATQSAGTNISAITAGQVSLLTCQSNRFIDNSGNSLAAGIISTPTVQAFSPFAPSGAYSASANGGAAYLDGSGNYLSVANNAALNITSGSTDSYVCDFWVNWSTVAANMSIVDNGGLNNVSFANWSVTLNASSQITLNWGSSAAPGSTIGILPTSIVPVTGQWYHIAFVKTNADWALFVNGTRATNYSGLNTAAKSSSTALYIGYGIATSAAGNAFKGYISNLRIYKGATADAPYSATSTTITVPTSPVTAITNTQLLTNFTNGGIVDAHSTSVVGTVGDAKISTVIKKFGSTSMAFDGSGDYLRIKYNPIYEMVTGDFTIECWVYRNVIGAEHNILCTRPGASATGWNLRINSSNTLQFYFTGGTSVSSTGTIPATTWTHIAFTKSGNNGRLFINGTIDGSTASMGTGTVSGVDLRIGVDNSDAAGYMNGYIDDLRITKGFARYTANFTAPTSTFVGS